MQMGKLPVRDLYKESTLNASISTKNHSFKNLKCQ